MEEKLNYDDITIVPEVITDIESRKECNPFECVNLPIFASCMSSVVDEKNFKYFLNNCINVVLPRTIPLEERVSIAASSSSWCKFVAFSLKEAQTLFTGEESLFSRLSSNRKVYICIDLANGHMKTLIDTIKAIKDKFGDKIVIMSGNIANPETYKFYEEAGADYVRVSIGTGDMCFVADTKITMANGEIENIEDVNVGDFVKTVNGTQKVINIFKKKTKETLVINDEIECTPNHKFFVIKKKDVTPNMPDEEILKNGFWLEAELLTNEYMLVQP